jgi:hypothetical protein
MRLSSIKSARTCQSEELFKLVFNIKKQACLGQLEAFSQLSEEARRADETAEKHVLTYFPVSIKFWTLESGRHGGPVRYPRARVCRAQLLRTLHGARGRAAPRSWTPPRTAARGLRTGGPGAALPGLALTLVGRP